MMMCKDMNSCLQVSYVFHEKRRVGLVVEMDTKFFDKYSCLFGCNPIFKSIILPCLSRMHPLQDSKQMFNFEN
jgi:hypothetical protein